MSTRPRLNVEITEEQHEGMTRIVNLGIKKRLFGVVVDQLILLSNTEQGREFLWDLLNDRVSLITLANAWAKRKAQPK